MKKNIRLSLLNATMITLFIFVISFIFLMFSTKVDQGLKTTLFNSLFFEAKTNSNGIVTLSAGTYNNFWWVFISSIIFIFSISMLALTRLNKKNAS
jgi:hypothetical protein